MKIKEFEGVNLKECLELVRQDMGPDAVILETKKLNKSGVLGMGKREAIKIVAATGVAVTSAPQPTPRLEAASVPTRPAMGAVAAYAAASGPRTEPVRSMPVSSAILDAGERPGSDTGYVARLEKEIRELRASVESVKRSMADPVVIPTPLMSGPITVPANRGTRLDRIGQAKVHAPSTVEPASARRTDTLLGRLIAADVDENIGRKLLHQMPDLSGWTGAARDAMAESALRDILSRQIACSGPINVPAGQQTVVALVGATGVGKTTTIAKLAAHYSLVEGRKVALLTMDTYRIAAVEQLKVYAQILGTPVKVVHSAADVKPAIESLAEYDLILIDTAGRSQKNVTHMEELRSALSDAGCQTHLVLAASTKRSDLKDQLDRFSKLDLHGLLFTKLDETSTYGSIFSIAAMADVPLSYLTTGQKVPEDIEVAKPSRLAGILVDSLPNAVTA